MSDSPILQVRDVTVQYKTKDYLVTATYRVNFDTYSSDRFVLLGPSGCGKSSLLKAIGGFIFPVEGSILLKGTQITQPGPDRVMVFQEFDQLLPWKTVKENIVFALESSGKIGKNESQEKALYYIEKVNLTKFANNYPHTLSGGMKQRVAIARGMAMEPEIILMDEPFGALDAQTRSTMQEWLLALWQTSPRAALFITHDIEEAVFLGDRVVVMSSHPGRVRADIAASFQVRGWLLNE